MDLKATYLRIQNNEPTYEDETYNEGDIKAIYLMFQQNELRQKTWSNQCMRDEWIEGSYNKNFENEIYEGHGRGRNNSSCERKDTRSLDYGSDSQMTMESRRMKAREKGVRED